MKGPPKKPHNIGYLSRLAQPKSIGKYVLVKEDSSDEDSEEDKKDKDKDKDKNVDDKQKLIKNAREERMLKKKGKN